MKPPCLKHLIYRTIFPQPSEGDPIGFGEFINRYIVPEVRTETVRFYGPIDDIEAKYPGLDYASQAHRLRLRQFPNHCRLFDAFDRLGLTYWEIYELCKWEGTKNAKDKYMKHNNVTITDTTWDGVKVDDRPRLPPASHRPSFRRPIRYDMQLDGAGDSPPGLAAYHSRSSPTSGQSRGSTLNRRVRAATAAYLRGQPLQLDPAYEQWLKEARERGTTTHPGELPPHFPPPSASPFPSHRSQARSLADPSAGAHQPPSSHFPYSRGNSDGRDYWLHAVPDRYSYGAQHMPRPATSTYPYVIESARRMMEETPLSASISTPGEGVPAWTVPGATPTDLRRPRRR